MKTMRRVDEIVRVKENQTDDYLNRGYSFCPKQDWKDNVRVIKKKKEVISEKVKEKVSK